MLHVTRRVALSVAAVIVLATGTIVALTGTARASQSEFTCTGYASGTSASCTLTAKIIAPTYITMTVTWAPVSTEISAGENWSGSCTLNGTTEAIPAAALNNLATGAGPPLNAGAALPFTDPASCTVTVTGAAYAGEYIDPNVAALTVTSDGQAAPSASPSASPSPSAPAAASSVHLVRGFDGTCVRDLGDSAARRTKVVIWACDPTAQGQGWTYRGDELRIHGSMCVNAKGKGTSGSPVILWPCDGSQNEVWVHRSDGEYVLKAGGGKMCLTDPGFSTANGTQILVQSCVDARDQRWSLP